MILQGLLYLVVMCESRDESHNCVALCYTKSLSLSRLRSYACAEDWARFGALFARDGVTLDGRRVSVLLWHC